MVKGTVQCHINNIFSIFPVVLSSSAPSLLDIRDVFRQTDVERLWEHEDQAAADDARPSEDQWWQKKPDVLQQHDHGSQGAADPAEAGGVAHSALPVHQHNQELQF